MTQKKQSNILVLTSLYPALDLEKENTPIVHYFTKEWIKMGCDVRVVHYPTNFPKIMMWAASFFKKSLSSKLGTTIRTRFTSECQYVIDDVKVKRIPLLKYKLHGRFPLRHVQKAFEKTMLYLGEEGFVPDIIVSHWVNPQLEIMQKIKEIFNVPTCYIAHTQYKEFSKIYNNEYSQLLIDNINLIGFRSAYIKSSFLNHFKYEGPTFQCYSGVPDKYIPQKPIVHDFSERNRFIFVGTLIKRKYPAEIISAVHIALQNEPFQITYIGRGEEEKRIRRCAQQCDVSEKVSLLGYMERDKVVKQLECHQFFVMISRSEAFGLVYLEAMAVGCIPIASRKEGFDGIIEDGKNGFLCEAGNVKELSCIISKIQEMTNEELNKLSRNATETARYLTDKKAAQKYLNELEKMMEKKA
jgi:glycosyltransferase involved in cell wall biosynthesis